MLFYCFTCLALARADANALLESSAMIFLQNGVLERKEMAYGSGVGGWLSQEKAPPIA